MCICGSYGDAFTGVLSEQLGMKEVSCREGESEPHVKILSGVKEYL